MIELFVKSSMCFTEHNVTKRANCVATTDLAKMAGIKIFCFVCFCCFFLYLTCDFNTNYHLDCVLLVMMKIWWLRILVKNARNPVRQ